MASATLSSVSTSCSARREQRSGARRASAPVGVAPRSARPSTVRTAVTLKTPFAQRRTVTTQLNSNAFTAVAQNGVKTSCSMKVIIAGAPASGKGTQCAKIVEKYNLAHISAGDLLRAEVAAGTEAGMKAKSFMDAGDLVPDDVVVTMVKARLAQDDAVNNGWLLDGYPRSDSQAQALAEAGIEPQLFILLDVPDDILVDRVVGRRLDPETGKIYHMTFSPPENEEIAARLTQRSDDTEEKCRNRVNVFHANVEAVVGAYKDKMQSIDGNRAPHEVFADIEGMLAKLTTSV